MLSMGKFILFFRVEFKLRLYWLNSVVFEVWTLKNIRPMPEGANKALLCPAKILFYYGKKILVYFVISFLKKPILVSTIVVLIQTFAFHSSSSPPSLNAFIKNLFFCPFRNFNYPTRHSLQKPLWNGTYKNIRPMRKYSSADWQFNEISYLRRINYAISMTLKQRNKIYVINLELPT